MSHTFPMPSLGNADHPARPRPHHLERAGRVEERETAKPPVLKSLRRDAIRRAEADEEIRDLMSLRPRW